MRLSDMDSGMACMYLYLQCISSMIFPITLYICKALGMCLRYVCISGIRISWIGGQDLFQTFPTFCLGPDSPAV